MNRPQNTWKILVSDKFGWRESNLIFILEESGKAEKIAMHLTYLIILFKYIINIYNVWQIIQIFVIKQLQKEIRKPTQRHLPSSHCLLRLSGLAGLFSVFWIQHVTPICHSKFLLKTLLMILWGFPWQVVFNFSWF